MGATPCRTISRGRLEDWHDIIGNHTFDDIMLDRLVHHSHRLTLTGGSSRRLRTYEFPTDHPYRPRPCPDDRQHPKRLTAEYPFHRHHGRLFMGRKPTSQLA
jgi:hypothetical protein